MRQGIYVITDKAMANGLVINTQSSIEDTRGTVTGTIIIEPNSPPGTFCDKKIYIGEINADGYVYASIWISDLEGDDIDNIQTRSFFNGQGANNDWDLDDKGRCASSGRYGIYMSAKGQKTCSTIEDVPDEDGVVIFTGEEGWRSTDFCLYACQRITNRILQANASGTECKTGKF